MAMLHNTHIIKSSILWWQKVENNNNITRKKIDRQKEFVIWLVYWIISDEIKINRKVYFLTAIKCEWANDQAWAYILFNGYGFAGIYQMLKAQKPFRYLLSIPITVLNRKTKRYPFKNNKRKKSRDQKKKFRGYYRWQIDKFVSIAHMKPVLWFSNSKPLYVTTLLNWGFGLKSNSKKKKKKNFCNHGPANCHWTGFYFTN